MRLVHRWRACAVAAAVAILAVTAIVTVRSLSASHSAALAPSVSAGGMFNVGEPHSPRLLKQLAGSMSPRRAAAKLGAAAQPDTSAPAATAGPLGVAAGRAGPSGSTRAVAPWRASRRRATPMSATSTATPRCRRIRAP